PGKRSRALPATIGGRTSGGENPCRNPWGGTNRYAGSALPPQRGSAAVRVPPEAEEEALAPGRRGGLTSSATSRRPGTVLRALVPAARSSLGRCRRRQARSCSRDGSAE